MSRRVGRQGERDPIAPATWRCRPGRLADGEASVVRPSARRPTVGGRGRRHRSCRPRRARPPPGRGGRRRTRARSPRCRGRRRVGGPTGREDAGATACRPPSRAGSGGGSGSRPARPAGWGRCRRCRSGAVRSPPIVGIEPISPWVYGWSGALKTCAHVADLDDLAGVHHRRRGRRAGRGPARSWLTTIRIAIPSSSRRSASVWMITRCTLTSRAVVGSSAMIRSGLEGDRHGDDDPLLHAAGELVRGTCVRPRARPARPGAAAPARAAWPRPC